MRDFEEYTGMTKDDSQKWVVETFELFDFKFTKFMNRYEKEKGISILHQETIFNALWLSLYSIIKNNVDEYILPLTNEQLIRKANSPIEFSYDDIGIDKNKVLDYIDLITIPIILILQQIEPLRITNRALIEMNKNLENNAHYKSDKIMAEYELQQILSPIAMFKIIVDRKKGYYKRIAEAIKPIYKKYGKAYGNKRAFLNDNKKFIQKVLKLKNSEFIIEHIEKYLPTIKK